MATVQDGKTTSDKPTRRPSSGVSLQREPSCRPPGFWSWRRPGCTCSNLASDRQICRALSSPRQLSPGQSRPCRACSGAWNTTRRLRTSVFHRTLRLCV